jgi:integrase
MNSQDIHRAEQALSLLLEAFGIGEAYEALVDLVVRLQALSRIVPVSDIPASEEDFWKDLSVLYDFLLTQRNRRCRGGTAYRGNPAGRLFDQSQVAALVTASAEDDKFQLKLDGLAATISALRIRHCCNGFEKKQFDSKSILIRSAFGKPNLYSKVLEHLPDFILGSAHRYYFKLFRKIQALRESEMNFSPKDRKLIRAIDFFINGYPPQRKFLVSELAGLSSVSSVNIALEDFNENDVGKTVLPGEFTRTIEFSDREYDDPIEDRSMYTEAMQGEEYEDDQNFQFRAKQAKYWLTRTGSLSRVSRTNLNPIEKSVFLKFLSGKIQDPDANKSLRAALLGMVYATGTPVEKVIYGRIGKGGLFTLDGEFRFHRPPLPIYYRCADKDAEVQPVYVLLPEILRDWFKANRQQFSGKSSIAQAFSITSKSMLKAIKLDLREVRDHGRFKIKLNRLGSALAAEVTQRFRDPVLTACLVGDFNLNSPVLTYYRAVSSAEIVSVYKQVISTLFDSPYQLEEGRIGVPPPEKLSSFINGIKERTLSIVKNPSFDVVQKHNAMTFYTWSLLHFATAHRPVQDPFCYLSDISLSRRCVLVSDKVVSPRYENRTIFLSQMAVEQIKDYINHLMRLRRSLMLRKDWQSRALGIAVIRLLEREGEQALPFLFLIEDVSKPTISITSENHGEYWSEFGVIEKNAGRSVIATELVRKGIPAQIVELHLGHLTDLSHPFGPRSESIPIESGENISRAVDEIMMDLGWEVISAKNTNEVRASKKGQTPKLNVQIHIEKVFGPEKRARIRQISSEKRRAVVSTVLEHFSFRQGDIKIESQELRQLEEEVREEAKIKGVNDSACLRLLWRWLRFKARRGLRIEGLTRGHVLPEEISPITREVLVQDRVCREAKENFQQLLDQRGKQKHCCTESGRVAEIIVSAALNDGVFGVARLQYIQHKVNQETYLQDKWLLCTLDDFTWVPGKTSRALIIGFKKRFEGLIINARQVRKELRELLGLLKIQVLKGDVYMTLSRLAHAQSIFRLPGAIRSACLNEREAVGLSRSTIARIMTGLRMDQDLEEKIVEKPENIEYFWALNDDSEIKKTVHRVYQEINSLFKKAKKAKPKGSERASRAKKKRLKILIKHYVKKERRVLPSIAVALLAWIVARCETGISGDPIKFNSVLRYKSEVLRPLLNLLHSHKWMTFSGPEIESIYMNALDWGNRSDKAWRARVIRDFHLFLESQIGIESPDWSGIFSYAGSRVPKDAIDANLLTEDEYFRCLEVIKGDKSLPPLLRQRYALVLILGYRFGLRIGEIMQLRYVDIQRNFDHLFVQVVTNVFGEKKSIKSLRQIPLVGEIEEYEEEIFDLVLAQCKIKFIEDRQTLLLHLGEARDEIDGNRMSVFLNRLLRYITGDNGAHFHHLRHGWVTRMMAIAFPGKRDSFWGKFRSKIIGKSGGHDSEMLWGKDANTAVKIRAISDAVGHVTESTTLSSYFHVHDLMGHDYFQAVEVYPSIQGYAYALNHNYGVLNARIATNKGLTSREEKILKAEKINHIFREYSEGMQKYDQMPLWENNTRMITHLTLNKIDRLLTVIANRNGKLEGIEALFGVSMSIINKVIEVADDLETKSGYEKYRVALAVNDPLLFRAKEVMGDKSFNLDETRRFREFSKEVESSLEMMNEMELRCIKRGIDAWTRAHQPQTRNIIVTSMVQLTSLFELFSQLKISEYKAELKLNYDDQWPSEVGIELDRYHIVTNQVAYRVSPVDKSKPRARFNLPIKISNISNGITTVDAFNRLLFCLGVALELRHN